MSINETLAASRAYEQIKKKIMQNQLDPHQSLNEIRLANELGLSRTPIREALVRLEQEELLTRYEQGRGFFVKHFSLQHVHDLFNFREIMETATAGQVIDKISEQDIVALAGILNDVNQIIADKRPAEALVRAMNFHLQITQLSTQNLFIVNALRNCYEKLIVISWSCQDSDACSCSAQEHQQILRSIKNRDLKELIECQRAHLHSARNRIIKLIRDDSQKLYFVP
ncbi:MAG: GntR family transcriptional regulator [Pseudomonadota bacterium]